MRNIPNLKSSLAFKSRLAFWIGIHVTLLAGVSPVKHQREVSRVFQRKKRNAIWTRVMLCFYLFQMAKTICQLVAWFKDTRVTQKSVPVGRVGRSVGRESCWLVGSLKLVKIILFGRNSFVLRLRFRESEKIFGISPSKTWKSGTLDERLCQHIVFICSLSRQRWGQMTIWPHLHEPKVGPWPRWPPPLRPPVGYLRCWLQL